MARPEFRQPFRHPACEGVAALTDKRANDGSCKSMIDVTKLWAKLARSEDGTISAWHSLPDHSADVAAVTEALLAQPVLAARLSRLADRSELGLITRARLTALAF